MNDTLFLGVAVSAENIIYFADGTNIRMIDRDGIISTIVGNHMHKSHWKPIPCEGTLSLEEVRLRYQSYGLLLDASSCICVVLIYLLITGTFTVAD